MTKLCWYQQDLGDFHGPFNSMEECKLDIINYYDGKEGDAKLSIAEVRHFCPEDWVDPDPETLFEDRARAHALRAGAIGEELLGRMNELLDDWHCCNNRDFDIDKGFNIPDDRLETAQQDLKTALKEWAKKHVVCEEWSSGRVKEDTTVQTVREQNNVELYV